MAILVDKNTKVICQGITGSFGALHTKGCFEYGTRMVGGVTPGKGGTKDANGLPIFNTVRDAVEATGADATLYAAPMSHGAGLYAPLHVLAGARHVCTVSQGFEPAEILGLARHFGRMHLFAAPTMVRPRSM